MTLTQYQIHEVERFFAETKDLLMESEEGKAQSLMQRFVTQMLTLYPQLLEKQGRHLFKHVMEYKEAATISAKLKVSPNRVTRTVAAQVVHRAQRNVPLPL